METKGRQANDHKLKSSACSASSAELLQRSYMLKKLKLHMQVLIVGVIAESMQIGFLQLVCVNDQRALEVKGVDVAATVKAAAEAGMSGE